MAASENKTRAATKTVDHSSRKPKDAHPAANMTIDASPHRSEAKTADLKAATAAGPAAANKPFVHTPPHASQRRTAAKATVKSSATRTADVGGKKDEPAVAPSLEQAPPRTLAVGSSAGPSAQNPGGAPAMQRPAAPSHAPKFSPSRPSFKPGLPTQKAAPMKTGVKLGFKPHEFIVYPAHGVGQIIAIEVQEVAGFQLELFVISFIKDKMILKVPTPKVASVGMRKLAEGPVIGKALDTLTGRARIKRTMWSRRAQEYEAKINSGDLIAIAEVVRDLYRSDAQPEQSYSERQLYEAAVDRMARELSVVNKITDQESFKLIETQLQKGPRRGGKAEAETEGDADPDGDVEEAA